MFDRTNDRAHLEYVRRQTCKSSQKRWPSQTTNIQTAGQTQDTKEYETNLHDNIDSALVSLLNGCLSYIDLAFYDAALKVRKE